MWRALTSFHKTIKHPEQISGVSESECDIFPSPLRVTSSGLRWKEARRLLWTELTETNSEHNNPFFNELGYIVKAVKPRETHVPWQRKHQQTLGTLLLLPAGSRIGSMCSADRRSEFSEPVPITSEGLISRGQMLRRIGLADWGRHRNSEPWMLYLTWYANTSSSTEGCQIFWKEFKVLHQRPAVHNTCLNLSAEVKRNRALRGRGFERTGKG